MEYTSRTRYLSSLITDQPTPDPRVQKAHDTYCDAVSQLDLYLDAPLADEAQADTVTALVAQIEECLRTVSSLLGKQAIRAEFVQEAQEMLNRGSDALSNYRAANPQGPQGTHIDLVQVADGLLSSYAQAAKDMKSFLDWPFGDFHAATKFAGGLKGCAHALMEHHLQYDEHTEETAAACRACMDAVEEWLKSAQVKAGNQPSSAFQLRSGAPARVGALMDSLAAAQALPDISQQERLVLQQARAPYDQAVGELEAYLSGKAVLEIGEDEVMACAWQIKDCAHAVMSLFGQELPCRKQFAREAQQVLQSAGRTIRLQEHPAFDLHAVDDLTPPVPQQLDVDKARWHYGEAVKELSTFLGSPCTDFHVAVGTGTERQGPGAFDHAAFARQQGRHGGMQGTGSRCRDMVVRGQRQGRLDRAGFPVVGASPG